ncbi:hypothetical protein [Variovorax terrae]|uniref:NHL repeat containing protein n=1 Tax=Variovorax terrae TaxID=2923278 RepID=A0A9X2ALS9_9BURK|nr:hypothetical protein [Variovorax terrae]MCJ0762619.1 hypothetical protein [Variovorax terrae]
MPSTNTLFDRLMAGFLDEVQTDRRNFLRWGGGLGLGLGAMPLLKGCGGSDGTVAGDPAAREQRQYFFNLGPAAASNGSSRFVLVAGSQETPLQRATPQNLQAIRQEIPTLPDDALTHVVSASLTASSPQLCYVKEILDGSSADWRLHTMFYHVPQAAASAAKPLLSTTCKAEGDLLRQAFSACPSGLSTQGIQALAASASFCVGPEYDEYKDYFDQAIALVSNHPEVGSFDAPTLSYIQTEILCRNQFVYDLAVSIFTQGPAATQPGGWATLEPVVDSDTGRPLLDADGTQVCALKYSQETLLKMGAAIVQVTGLIKNDPNLGANITGLDPAQAAEALRGKSWFVNDGTPTAAGQGSGLLKAGAGLAADKVESFTRRDVSGGAGFYVENLSNTNRTVSFRVRNSYLRYLGLYARFLDAAGKPIALTQLADAARRYPYANLNGDLDGFLRLINQQFAILGIPISDEVVDVSIALPTQASTLMILAGGLGAGSKTYPATIDAGAIMTAVLCLAVPGIFLVSGACAGYANFCRKLTRAADLALTVAEAVVKAMVAIGLSGTYHDTSTYNSLIIPILNVLRKGVPLLFELMTDSLIEGQTVAAASSATTFGIGLILQAVMAAGLAAQITRTSINVANSPWTYAIEVGLTHDLAVTIHHDPAHAAGFPNAAASYELVAVCDGASPRKSGAIAMPSTTRTAPLVYTFQGLPQGGKVNLTVTFLTASGELVGSGAASEVDNTQNAASLTIKEIPPMIGSRTRYAHKQKTALDGGGNHVWAATATPPDNPLDCLQAGQLCELMGITLSDPRGAVGYGWRARIDGVSTRDGSGSGQLYHLAALSVTDTPQAGFTRLPYGFSTPPRIAYDRDSPSGRGFYIDTTLGQTVVRRVTTPGVNMPAAFDGAGQAVGRFNLSSDAFLIHPTGKLISFNSADSKMEVLTPAANPVADADAPLAQSLAGPGQRDGLMLGPVVATVMHDGTILVVEARNSRVQAFDTGANPVRIFKASTWFALRSIDSPVAYLDISTEATGLIYVLLRNTATGQYFMDIYDKTGTFVASTPNVVAGKLAVSVFRDVYTLNYENLYAGRGTGQAEPSVSLWIPGVI